MSRYIDADKEYIDRCTDCLYYEPCKEWARDCFGDDNTFPYEWTEDFCEHFKPTTDVVEVVRCKDCKYFIPFKKNVFCKGDCSCNDGLGDFVRPNDYCSHGVRKDGEEE